MLISMALVAWAEDPPPADPYRPVLVQWLRDQGADDAKVEDLATSMLAADAAVSWQTGTVSLKGGTVVLQLAEGDRYAPPADADRIIQGWGNPPAPNTLGILFPAGAHVFGPGVPVIVTASDDGWVDDSDAQAIDYDELLEDMKKDQEADSVERRKSGLEGVVIDGWAAPPRYDATTHVLYWAKNLRGDSGGVTLNYDVRVLGRKGVLSLNALAGPDQLADVQTAMERVRDLASFEAGSRYADYTPGVDAKAAYGLAALVAGGALAAKAGGFKALLAILLASKKLLIAGLAAVSAGVRGFWGRLSGAKARAPDQS